MSKCDNDAIPNAITVQNIADLVPYKNNARTHSKDQIARIAESIKEFGWANTVLIDGNLGIVGELGKMELDPVYCDVIIRRWAEVIYG